MERDEKPVPERVGLEGVEAGVNMFLTEAPKLAESQRCTWVMEGSYPRHDMYCSTCYRRVNSGPFSVELWHAWYLPCPGQSFREVFHASHRPYSLAQHWMPKHPSDKLLAVAYMGLRWSPWTRFLWAAHLRGEDVLPLNEYTWVCPPLHRIQKEWFARFSFSTPPAESAILSALKWAHNLTDNPPDPTDDAPWVDPGRLWHEVMQEGRVGGSFLGAA